jgi:AcrR family transcriptional regulator
MGRPSRAAERTEQIMAATRTCLRVHGLAGTTLERVAKESGLSRSHVRHYVGNREDLLRSFSDWLFTGFENELAVVAAAAPPEERLEAVLEWLFGTGFLPVSDDDTVVRELITAGLSDETLRAGLQTRYEHAVKMIASVVRASAPMTTPKQAGVLAYGIWCLALGNSTMAEIGLSEATRATPRRVAESLVTAMTPQP